jgi:hypothetical protein
MLRFLSLIILLFQIAGCGRGTLKFGTASITSDPTPYNFLGQLDTDFGTAGVVNYANYFDASKSSWATKIIETSLGNLYVLSYAETAAGGNYRSYLRKFSSNGTPDLTFGTGGYFELPSVWGVPTEDAQYTYATLVNNRYIVLAGDEQSGADVRIAVAVFDTTTDDLKADFGTNGIATFDLGHPTSIEDYPNALAYDSYRNLIVIGSRSVEQPGWINQRSSVIAVDWTGNLSPLFNSGSVFWPADPGLVDSHWVSDLAVTSSAYLVNVSQFDDASTYSQSIIAKIDMTGNPVAAFGTNGFSYLESSTQNVYGMKIHSNELILPMNNFDGTTLGVGKMNLTTGVLDPTFGTAGVKDLTAGLPSGYASVWSSDIIFHPDGKILFRIGFSTPDDSAIIVMDSNYDVLTSYGTDGYVMLANPVGGTRNWATAGITLLANGHVAVGTTCDNSGVMGECVVEVK